MENCMINIKQVMSIIILLSFVLTGVSAAKIDKIAPKEKIAKMPSVHIKKISSSQHDDAMAL